MRLSNIEALRIISMLLICALHANFSALGVPDVVDCWQFSDFIRLEYESIALVAVNIFILISGYFSIHYDQKRIINLCFMILFWSIVLSVCARFYGLVSSMQALKLVVPGLNDWFVQCYLLLILVSPLCNSFVEKIRLKTLKKYLTIFFLTEFIFGWLIFWGYAFDGGYSVLHFIGLYLVGRYLRLSHCMELWSAKKMLMCFFMVVSIPAVFLYIIMLNTGNEYIISFLIQRFTAYTSPFNVFGAILLFNVMRKTKLQNKIANRLAASAFSVYLIHTFPPVFTLYKEIAINLFSWNNMLWPVTLILFVCFIYIICCILDQIRIVVYNILIKSTSLNFWTQCSS